MNTHVGSGGRGRSGGGDPIGWILFDWGNVLVDYRPLGFPRLAARLGVPLDALVSELGAVQLVERLSVGSAGPAELCELLRSRFGEDLGEADLCELFADDVAVRMPGIEAVIEALRGRHGLAILSNTFFAHYHHMAGDPFYEAFAHRMASHLLGACKPDVAIFERALARLGCRAQEVVFIDDKRENTDVARGLGMRAIHAPDVTATRAGLAALGCLP